MGFSETPGAGVRGTLVRTALLCLLFAAAARTQTYVLIVSGLGGDTVYSKRFAALSRDLTSALHDRAGIPLGNIVRLGEDSMRAEPSYAGRSTRQRVEQEFASVVARAEPRSTVVLALIGHGAGEGAESRLSIPGPDLTATDFARMLGRLTTQRVAVLDLSSASGDMLALLSAPTRVVITATKTSLERNESHFATFFVKAYSVSGADTDKDGRVSLLEAFRYAAAETKRFYESENKIQTEHAQLDDNGDRVGSAAPDARAGDGVVARRFFLDARSVAARGNDARLPALYDEQLVLEDSVEALKHRKPQLLASVYGDELERLLIALARKARTIREIEGR